MRYFRFSRTFLIQLNSTPQYLTISFRKHTSGGAMTTSHPSHSSNILASTTMTASKTDDHYKLCILVNDQASLVTKERIATRSVSLEMLLSGRGEYKNQL